MPANSRKSLIRFRAELFFIVIGSILAGAAAAHILGTAFNSDEVGAIAFSTFTLTGSITSDRFIVRAPKLYDLYDSTGRGDIFAAGFGRFLSWTIAAISLLLLLSSIVGVVA